MLPIMNIHIGSDSDDSLAEEGILAEAEAAAIKCVIASQVEHLMADQRLTRSEMARRMATSHSALNRLLDPSNSSVTLQTLERAAAALGKRLRIELV